MAGFAKPIVTVDVALLTLKGGELHTVLVLRDKEPREGEWTLPGGSIDVDEDQDALGAAQRILRTKAGVESPYLEQLETFASRHRDRRGWSVSIGYYALVPYADIQAQDRGRGLLRWRAVDEIRSLPFDHLQILHAAVARVRSKTLYSSLPVHLMPATFTLRELQEVYEQLLDAKLDKRSFRRRIEELGVVEKATRNAVKAADRPAHAHRPAQLFQRRRHRELVTSDRNLGIKG
jgi:8-oxo-dGTP diphosphatase